VSPLPRTSNVVHPAIAVAVGAAVGAAMTAFSAFTVRRVRLPPSDSRRRGHHHREGAVCLVMALPIALPIPGWEPNQRLLSLYANVIPPHLDGCLKPLRGEFRIITLPDGRTRLEAALGTPSRWPRRATGPSHGLADWHNPSPGPRPHQTCGGNAAADGITGSVETSNTHMLQRLTRCLSPPQSGPAFAKHEVVRPTFFREA
jgi:hypothetical protein